MEYYLIPLIVFAVVFGLVGMTIGDLGGKKNGPVGFLLGALLGPIGCIIAAVIPPAADSDKAKEEAAEKARISKLEAELAALKTGAGKSTSTSVMSKPIAGSTLGKDLSDDGGIPTYKLD